MYVSKHKICTQAHDTSNTEKLFTLKSFIRKDFIEHNPVWSTLKIMLSSYETINVLTFILPIISVLTENVFRMQKKYVVTQFKLCYNIFLLHFVCILLYFFFCIVLTIRSCKVFGFQTHNNILIKPTLWVLINRLKYLERHKTTTLQYHRPWIYKEFF